MLQESHAHFRLESSDAFADRRRRYLERPARRDEAAEIGRFHKGQQAVEFVHLGTPGRLRHFVP